MLCTIWCHPTLASNLDTSSTNSPNNLKLSTSSTPVIVTPSSSVLVGGLQGLWFRLMPRLLPVAVGAAELQSSPIPDHFRFKPWPPFHSCLGSALSVYSRRPSFDRVLGESDCSSTGHYIVPTYDRGNITSSHFHLRAMGVC